MAHRGVADLLHRPGNRNLCQFTQPVSQSEIIGLLAGGIDGLHDTAGKLEGAGCGSDDGLCSCVARLGASLTTCLSIAGQLLFSIPIDHFGLLGMRRLRFDPKRLPALGLIAAGLALVTFAS